jgi:Domain of unknown function (DUF4345)
MMQDPGIALTSVNHFHVIRAAYGGAYIGIGALFFWGLARPALTDFALTAVLVLFAGFALGRVCSMVVDGMPIALYAFVLAAELFFAASALLCLRKQRM